MGIVGLGGIKSQKDIDLIYKYTIKDYRSIIDGVKYTMYLDDERGTILSPIKNLPTSIFNLLLKQAKLKSKK